MEKIRIDEPCSASWRKMTPEGEGRFCGSCAKVVVDFTKKTDEEIIAFFSGKDDEHICGRFTTAQVSTPALDRRRAFFRKAASIFTFVLGLSLISACVSHASKKNRTQGYVRKPPAPAGKASHNPGKFFRAGSLLLAIFFLFGSVLASSCRRHVKGRRKFPVQVKAKTEQVLPDPQR